MRCARVIAFGLVTVALASVAAADEPQLYVTKENYVASTSLDDLKKILSYVDQGDKEAFKTFLENSTTTILLKGGIKVHLVRPGIIYVKVRVHGKTIEVWTQRQAIEPLKQTE